MRARLDKILLQYQAAKSAVRNERRELQQSESELDSAKTAQAVLQSVAELIQQEAHERISSVVTRCLEAVFDEPYEFRILFEKKRGRTEAKLALARGDMILDNPLKQAGGGVVSLAAFALRLVCLILSRPMKRRLLVLDEPLVQISENYREGARVLLETLAEEMDCQIIMVTHSDTLMTGKVIEL